MNYKTSYSKFGNHRCEYKGIKFASHRERDRFIFLSQQQRLGRIVELRLQVPYQLLEDEYMDEVVHLKTKDKVVRKKVFTGVKYIADFVYRRTCDGREVVEDVKSNLDTKKAIDNTFFIKEKMMHSLLGIDIYKVDSPTAPV